MAVSLYDIHFNQSTPHEELCTLIINGDDVLKLKEAIEDLYYFEFVFGELLLFTVVVY